MHKKQSQDALYFANPPSNPALHFFQTFPLPSHYPPFQTLISIQTTPNKSSCSPFSTLSNQLVIPKSHTQPINSLFTPQINTSEAM